MTKGQFKIKKILNEGTSNPIVAALTIGLHDIVRMADIDSANRDKINATNLSMVGFIVKAEKNGIEICSSIEKVANDLNVKGVQTQSFDRCVTVPSTERLENIRDFLKYGKQTLQELVKIINVFIDTNVSNPRYDKLLKEFEKVYGKNDPATIALKKDHDVWIKNFLNLRDQDEHPTVECLYYDFDINWDDEAKKWVLEFPRFYNGTPIYEFAKASIYNIFTFCEEMNIFFLQKHMPKIVQICKVPEDKQSEYGGRRFVVELKEEYGKFSHKKVAENES